MSARTWPHRRRAVVTGTLVAVALTSILLVVAVRFASRNPDRTNLGPRVLRLDADRLAREIDTGGPSLFKDPLNRGREVYVQHVGADPDTGWLAIGAYASRPTVDCLLRWQPRERQFLDPCTGRTYPAGGEGLTTYPANVEDGVVNVDLRRANRAPAPASEAPAPGMMGSR